MENMDYTNIPKEKLKFAAARDLSHDKKLVTKPRTYMQDALSRFAKNKGAIFGAIVIAVLLVFVIVGSIFTPYAVDYSDDLFISTLPKCEWFANTNFWDGCENKSMNSREFNMYYYAGQETGHYAIKNQEFEKKGSMYYVRLDSYQKHGCKYKIILESEYKLLQQYQLDKDVQVIYPTIENGTVYSDESNRLSEQAAGENVAQYYYKTSYNENTNVLKIEKDKDGNIIPIYLSHPVGEKGKDDYDSLRIAGDGDNGVEYEYAILQASAAEDGERQYEVRINYYEYYIFKHTYVYKDGITKPSFLFGTTTASRDVFTCLCSGALFSYAFAIAIALVNLVVGAIYGAIEGYYGGKTDLVMERISDVLSAVPTMIVITLLKEFLKKSISGTLLAIMVLFIAYIATGWIGMASRTRMQFYRYKNQEYVLAARTLGAKDRRIIWKHIFPNALGTLVTSCALIIPSMIYSEINLSYLGIISLESGKLTSVGVLLSNGQEALKKSIPHIAMFPAVYLALLLLAFNLFGNGLRDAFNPSLRGAED